MNDAISAFLKGYLIAFLSIVAVLIIRLVLLDSIADRVPLLLPMIVAVFLSAWYGGLKPGLLATFLGVVLALILLPAEQSYWRLTFEIRLVMFVGEGLAISFSLEAMHKARQRLEKKQHELEEENRERRRVEQELMMADRRKNDFLAALAHELRNPLAPISYGLEVLRHEHDNAALQESTYALIDRQIRQMVSLVDDLLDMSRIQRNNLELRKQQVELATIIRSAVETSRPLIESHGHTLTVLLSSEPVIVEADPARLAQVFSNLLNNATKFTEQGGHISLTVERAAVEVLVKIRDNGIGIPAEMLSSVFEMFMQIDPVSERNHGGMGIGLSLVKRLTEMHGGSVMVQSEGLGRGSEFIVRLPCAALSNGLPQTTPSRDVSPSVAATGRRVLVVDDNQDALSSLANMLVLLGNHVRTAQDGLEAVALAALFKPEVVFLDLGMPRMDGYEAARQIREQPWGKEMVLVAHTGWGQEEARRRTHEAGFDYHLTKPAPALTLESILADVTTRC